MIPFDSHHDTGTKLLLNGVTLPAGGTAQADLTAALQNIFNHPNVGPFICKQLIEHLVTSNPSPEYVGRVAAVFADNGSGVRGDLKAVVRLSCWIQKRAAATIPTQAQPNDGKLKEPVLFITNLLRAMNACPTAQLVGPRFGHEAVSVLLTDVFNFYHPDHRDPGQYVDRPRIRNFQYQHHHMPESISSTTLVYGQVSNTTTVDLSGYVPLAANPDQLVTAIAAVMLHGQVSDSTRSTLVSTLSAISDNTRRTKAAFYLIGSSSQFQVEH